MKHLTVLVLLALGLLLAGAASASKPNPFAFRPQTGTVQTSVYQQPGVTNPTACAWSSYDAVRTEAGGDLLMAGSSQGHLCVIEDNAARYVDVGIQSPGGELVVTLEIGDDELVTLAPQHTGTGPNAYTYMYRQVIGGYTDLSSLPAIADSNGGRGEREDLTLTVTNLGKTAHNTRAVLSVSTGYVL